MTKNNKPRGQEINQWTLHLEALLLQKEEYIKLHPREALSEKHLHDFERAGIKPEV